jgi:uncharacterized membrane protein HdeD (DUF308 family)
MAIEDIRGAGVNTGEIAAPAHAGFAVAGALLILLGGVALMFPFVSTIAVTLLAGALFAAAGLVKLGLALLGMAQGRFGRQPWRLALNTLWGLLYLAGGSLILYAPLAGALSLTIVLAALLIAAGAASIAWAMLKPRPAGWGWMLASGLISMALGVIVIVGMPIAALWFPGVVAGVDFLTTGVAFIAMTNAGHDAHGRAQAMTR